MTRRLGISIALLALALLVSPFVSKAQQAPSGPGAEMVDAALKFWNALTPEQQGKAGFTFADAERMNWHFTPQPTRKGLPWKEMTPAQRALGEALVKTGLSQAGVDKTIKIQQQENTLRTIESAARAGGGSNRDPENYMIVIFGKPGPKEAWGWRYEGHHLSFNFTLTGTEVNTIASAPNFLGSNPAKVPADRPNAGLRILGNEEDLGRKLIKALSEEHRKIAIFTETAPRDIITGEQQRPAPITPAGIAADKLTAEQRKMLMDIIAEYAGRVRPELAKADIQKIEQAGMDKLWFGWAGSTEVGGPHYYRIQGTTFLIEYDNTQNNNNHIHAVWRDGTNDFGEDILKKHLQASPH